MIGVRWLNYSVHITTLNTYFWLHWILLLLAYLSNMIRLISKAYEVLLWSKYQAIYKGSQTVIQHHLPFLAGKTWGTY
uniref:Uncharacterized protein n=1 Tax=Rhizophora mucronata TaxID=61149 RepID=A0A2P2J1F9_RHIMU